MVYTGERLAIGSWNIMDISFPRSFLMALLSGEQVTRSTGPLPSSYSILPPKTFPGFCTVLRMEWAVTLLPQPDSPMIPIVSFLFR